MLVNPEPSPICHISKSFIDVRIDTSYLNNWRLVAAKDLQAGQKLTSHKIGFQLLCPNADLLKIYIEEDSCEKEMIIERYAIPIDSSCIPKLIEIPWCFMNHSCDPNTFEQWEHYDNLNSVSSLLVIKHDIPQGDELTIDYCLEQYQYPAPFKCLCNSKICRKKVFGFVELTNSQKQELLSYVSPYVKDRYANESNQLSTTEFH